MATWGPLPFKGFVCGLVSIGPRSLLQRRDIAIGQGLPPPDLRPFCGIPSASIACHSGIGIHLRCCRMAECRMRLPCS